MLVHIRRNPIIAIDKSHQFSGCDDYPCISGIRQASIRLVYHPNTAIFFRPCIAHGGAAIRRSIVHQDDFQIRIRLVYDGGHALIQIWFHLIDRDDNADLCSIHRVYLPASRILVTILAGSKSSSGTFRTEPMSPDSICRIARVISSTVFRQKTYRLNLPK